MSDLSATLHGYLSGLDVVEIEVLRTDREPSFRGSDVSTEASQITAAARDRHLSEGYGFWDNVVASAVTASSETRAGLLAGAARTKTFPVTAWTMPVADFISSLEDGTWDRLPGRQLVSLSTRVKVRNGTVGHLNLLDFGLPNREQLDVAIRAALKILDISGPILATGRSYHLYGSRVTDWDTYVRFLARAALLSPLVDARWALHQIAEGRAGLRISTNTERDVSTPTAISS